VGKTLCKKSRTKRNTIFEIIGPDGVSYEIPNWTGEEWFRIKRLSGSKGDAFPADDPTYEPGDIVLVNIASFYQGIENQRPALFLKDNDDRSLVLLMTSNLEEYEEEPLGLMIEGDMLAQGLIRKKAYVSLGRPALVHRSFLVRKIGALKKDMLGMLIRKMIHEGVVLFYECLHKPATGSAFSEGPFKVQYGGRVFDEKEMINLVDSALDFWLTAGKYANEFEKRFADFLGVKYCSLCNSGSSANLLAFMAITSPKLGEKRVRKGDEVITVAAGFPTTVTPIINYGAVPVFVDITIPTYNVDCSQLELALTDKTKAVILAHTLGNPFDVTSVKKFCDRHNLWLIEDNCDALGSRYHYQGEWCYTGTFGDVATSSFYPSHHITMGEGGAVYTNNPELHRIINSFRDWGRDCWCASGQDNTCKRRFQWQMGELPYGYDHKYIYSHFGYNLRITEMQAAVGCAQLEKLERFIEVRKRNWKLLRDGLVDLDDRFILPEPTPNSDPSWFGFALTVREDAGFTRDGIVRYLEMCGIQTRMLFAGNFTKHPCFDEIRKNGKGYRIIGDLRNSERITRDTFWIGVYPGLNAGMIGYVIEKIREFVKRKVSAKWERLVGTNFSRR
jgi:CDP-6-deoxy-D-xylo-4-hexulose-3-dehydrase